MNRSRWMWTYAALAVIGATGAPTRGADPPEMNRLTGVVVFRENGRPAANVQVVLSHERKGYIYITETGLQGYGEEEKVLGIFTKRNSKHFCQAVTDDQGRFTLKNFAAPDEAWHLATGDPRLGYTLQIKVRPRDYADKSLRLELDKPAFLSVTPPAAPEKSIQTMIGVNVLSPAPADAEAQVASEEDGEIRVYYWSQDLWNASPDKALRIGPLPVGPTYRVSASVYKQGLFYQPLIAARSVVPVAGETRDVSLAPPAGAAVTGRVTDIEDKPLSNVNVRVKAADGMILGVLTDHDGKYALSGVPAGTHRLELLRHAARRTPG